VERYRVPRGDGHSREVKQETSWEGAEWKRHQERLRMVRAAVLPRGRDGAEEEALDDCERDDSERDDSESDVEAEVKKEAPGGSGGARLVGRLDASMAEQEKLLGDLRDYVETVGVPDHVPEFEDCHDRQIDRPLADLDFVVELEQGQDPRGPPYLKVDGSAIKRPCRCGAESSVSLLVNASEAERCLVARRTFQGSYSTLCKKCLRRKGEEAEAETRELRRLLPENERDQAVLLRFRDRDAEGRLRAYRVFAWMASRGVEARIQHFDETPRFVLKDVFEMRKLVDALDLEAKGALVHAKKGVCVPHFSDPLDEALSTMEGKRTFMQTLEAQSFSSIKGMKKELLACFRERNWMQIMDGVDEALVGSRSSARWEAEE